jgi:hypothetical protein
MRCVFTATDDIVTPHTAQQLTVFPPLNTNYLPVGRFIHKELQSPVSYHWWSSSSGTGTGCGVRGWMLECFLYHNCQLLRSYTAGDRICVCGIEEVFLPVEDLSMQKKTSPSATLPTTNPTWTGMRLKSSLHGESLAANHLSHGRTEQLIWTHAAKNKPVNNQLKFGGHVV